MPHSRIPLSQPSITALEVSCVTDAVRSGWVSSRGKYIDRFEESFAAYCGTQYALTTSSGTTALHLALLGYDIGPGDEVIIPDISFISTANAVTYTGATPVFVDIDADTLCIDIEAVRTAITSNTKAIIAVHLYGHPANMPALKAIADTRKIPIIEDAAEAHGASIHGKRTGALGNSAIFSFYGNKIVTCGEGGMVTTNNTELYNRIKHLRNQAMSSTQRYWHTTLGFNYRMTNMQAALGFAQMKRIDQFIAKKKQIFADYQRYLGRHSGVRLNSTASWADHVFWQVCLEVDGWSYLERNHFMELLSKRGVETRPFFYPLSDMPMYQHIAAAQEVETPVAHRVAQQGMNLPSYFDMTEKDVKTVCDAIKSCLAKQIKGPTKTVS